MIVVTGTDTGIGKTVFAAALTVALGAHYWKPVQAGLDPRSDADSVATLSGLPAAHILPEAYRLANSVMGVAQDIERTRKAEARSARLMRPRAR